MRRCLGTFTSIIFFALGVRECLALPDSSPAGQQAGAGPDWAAIKAQPCNLGLQDKYGKPFWHGTRPFATCGVYNEETDIDFSGKPCCCEFCGQRDPFEQLCEITTLLCTSVNDCIQRHNGMCKASAPALNSGGLYRFGDPFHVFWMTVVVVTTIAPFVVPVVALWYAQEIILGF
mmetsp:Transcript_104895/g.168908  ORF Transcript_104895/g.168908 Transcript_104895/m.168908 type:complete len:175 (+) Transcript_104895:77-601(+)